MINQKGSLGTPRPCLLLYHRIVTIPKHHWYNTFFDSVIDFVENR